MIKWFFHINSNSLISILKVNYYLKVSLVIIYLNIITIQYIIVLYLFVMFNNHSVISLFKDKRKFLNNFNLIEDNDGMMITNFICN